MNEDNSGLCLHTCNPQRQFEIVWKVIFVRVCKFIFPAKRSLRSDNSAGSGKAISVNGCALFKYIKCGKIQEGCLRERSFLSPSNCMRAYVTLETFFQAGLAFPLKHLINQADVQFY